MKTYLIYCGLSLTLMTASSCISIGGGSHTPASTTTVTEKTQHPQPLSNPSLTQTTETTTTRIP